MTTDKAVATVQPNQVAPKLRDPSSVMEEVIAKGDLSKLQPEDRARYYVTVCESMGLNPLTRPFLYIDFGSTGGGLQLYPGRNCADQLRGIHKVETRIIERSTDQGIYTVVIEARHPDGRVETDIGAVPIEGQKGLFLANAMKKAITQGKRRTTLAMLGLALIDDDEIKAIRGARVVPVDTETGEILPEPERQTTVTEVRSNGNGVAHEPPEVVDADRLATPQQLRAIKNSFKKHQFEDDDLTVLLGVVMIDHLSFAEAAQWIGYLNSASREEISDKITERMAERSEYVDDGVVDFDERGERDDYGDSDPASQPLLAGVGSAASSHFTK